jgi:serine/threonine-protein kinase
MPEVRLPPRIGGKYQPLRFVARGGMGTIYEVEHLTTGEHWALKVLHRAILLDPAGVERFKREARVSARVKSEHIVRVIDADVAEELDGAPYMVMELLEGQDIGQLVGDQPQPNARVVSWLRQVARGLEKAHALGIVHRDLKPANLFLSRRHDEPPILKILDFGVAKISNVDDVGYTVAGAVVGTPLYMAPEQAASRSEEIGSRADVWAIGIIAYRLLSGRDYWSGPSLPQLLARIVSTDVEAPSKRGIDLGDAFDGWFLRACARRPEDRFATVTEQIEALASVLDVTAPPIAFAETLPHVANEENASLAGSVRGTIATPDEPQRQRGLRPLPIAVGIAAIGAIGVAAVLSQPASSQSTGSQRTGASAALSAPLTSPADASDGARAP